MCIRDSAYTLRDVRQGKDSTERTPAQIVVSVALSSRYQASGIPTRQANIGEGVHDSVCFPTHPSVLLRGSVGGREHLQQFVTLHDLGAVNGNVFFCVSVPRGAAVGAGVGSRAVQE